MACASRAGGGVVVVPSHKKPRSTPSPKPRKRAQEARPARGRGGRRRVSKKDASSGDPGPSLGLVAADDDQGDLACHEDFFGDDVLEVPPPSTSIPQLFTAKFEPPSPGQTTWPALILAGPLFASLPRVGEAAVAYQSTALSPLSNQNLLASSLPVPVHAPDASDGKCGPPTAIASTRQASQVGNDDVPAAWGLSALAAGP